MARHLLINQQRARVTYKVLKEQPTKDGDTDTDTGTDTDTNTNTHT